ncbi:glycosyltransferase family 9 protein [Oleispirillum naphthae]|uniref:glycosyltransferase family 9 protein n=1 Tax=Oleispirillum naphthae TaxID=2838853 RepID=UPI00308263E0
MTGGPRILVIKLGALGDVVQSFGPLAAIRRHHPDAAITVLTTRPYAALYEACPDVDAVWIDRRPRAHQVGGWLDLRRRLRGGGFFRVYDLQTSDRSSGYFRLMRGLCPWGRRSVEWSGIAAGCSHPHANPDRDRMHTVERQAEQLRMAGIADAPPSDLSWLAAEVSGLAPAGRFVLLAPGGAAHRPGKRWPAERYGELARRLLDAGVTPVLLGTRAEEREIAAVTAAAPGAVSLIGRTGFAEIASLGRAAAAAVGNDTGPMHLLAAVGCPCVVLYAKDSDPALCAQRGPKVRILRREALSALAAEEVWAELAELAESADLPDHDG